MPREGSPSAILHLSRSDGARASGIQPMHPIKTKSPVDPVCGIRLSKLVVVVAIFAGACKRENPPGGMTTKDAPPSAAERSSGRNERKRHEAETSDPELGRALPAMGADEIKKAFPGIVDWVEHASNEELSTLMDSIDCRSPEKQNVVFLVLRKFSTGDPRAYIKYACRLEPKSNLLVLPPLLESVTRADPVAVLEFIDQNYTADPSAPKTLADSLLRSLLGVMPESGIAFLANHKTPGSDALILEGLQGWGARDLTTALAYLQGSNLNTAERLNALIQGGCASHPETAYSIARGQKLPISDTTYRLIFSKWVTSSPKGATAAMLDVPGEDFSRLFSGQPSIVTRLCKEDPGAAAAILAKVSRVDGSLPLVGAALTELAMANRDGALDWVLQHSNGDSKGQLLGGLAKGWPVKDQQQLLKVLPAVEGNSKAAFFHGIAEASLAEKSAPLAFAEHLTREDQRVFAAVALEATLDSGLDAALATLSDKRLRTDVLGDPAVRLQIEKIASAYAERSLPESRQWLESYDGGMQVPAVTGMMKVWVRKDPIAAGEWLQGLEPTAGRDAGIQCLIEEIEPMDRATADNWKKLLTK